MKKTLPFTEIGFVGRTGDDRYPESFPFPACMTSLMQFLGEGDPVVTRSAHGAATPTAPVTTPSSPPPAWLPVCSGIRNSA